MLKDEDYGYELLLKLIRDANLDFAKLADQLVLPENRLAYNAIPRLKRPTRLALGGYLDAAIEQRRKAGLPLPEDRGTSPWKDVVYRIKINKVSIYSVLVRYLQQLLLSPEAMKGLVVALEATAGIHHCEATEDRIVVTLTGQLSMADAADTVMQVLRSYLGRAGYVVDIDIE